MSKRKGKIVAPVPEATSHLGYSVGDVIKCKVRKVACHGAITDIHLEPTPCFSFFDEKSGQFRVARFEDITSHRPRVAEQTEPVPSVPEPAGEE
jgi:hypothetical protein